MKDDRILVYDPQPDVTNDEMAALLNMVMFQTYPPELKTRENMLILFDKLPKGAKRHFKIHKP